MAKIFPLHPARPELICWGCDRYCPAGDMVCGNGSDRTQHPAELFGEDWHSFGLNAQDAAQAGSPADPAQADAAPPAPPVADDA
jgi:hypothetical protein